MGAPHRALVLIVIGIALVAVVVLLAVAFG